MIENKTPMIIGSDHAAFPLKEILKKFIAKQDIPIQDVGTFSESSVNYPEFGIKVARAVSEGEFKRGLLLCGTGLGMSMVANRFPHVRAALCGDVFSAKMSREHNDSNILVIGGRMIGETLAIEIVKTWLETPFAGGRHQTRLDQFDVI
ncbi:MAG: ribose 5-phosphate isomerase B [Pseudomonadota bacterium]